ncbi:hypothetical protein MTR_2g105660 [Medicago truncatula]|uniref:Uncharacterized protein n=1 Tax=Medicago truncatula TaxID=3880 RepID=A0A072VDK1_MEDTR|nr:hypothetical protein MTR_2g105660 [Medicago truncatula]
MSPLEHGNLIDLSSCKLWSHDDPYMRVLTLSVDFGLSLRLLSCICWSHGDPYVCGLTPSEFYKWAALSATTLPRCEENGVTVLI